MAMKAWRVPVAAPIKIPARAMETTCSEGRHLDLRKGLEPAMNLKAQATAHRRTFEVLRRFD
jgi:hypothetical protein